MDLPITMDPSKYGEIRISNSIEINGDSIERFIVVSGDKTYQIDVYNKGIVNKITIFRKNKLIMD
jgi:hypothetical protein